jgi:hypothetical protein
LEFDNGNGVQSYNSAFDAIQSGSTFYLIKDDEDYSNDIQVTLESYQFCKSKDSDIILFYFSGHGSISDDDGDGWTDTYYLNPFEFNSGFSYELLSHVDFKTIFDSFNYKYNIVVLDACYSGSWAYVIQESNRIILTSTWSGRYTADFYAMNFASRLNGLINARFDITGSGKGTGLTDENNVNFDTCIPKNGNEEKCNADGNYINYRTPYRENINSNYYRNQFISIQETYCFICYALDDRYGGLSNPLWQKPNFYPYGELLGTDHVESNLGYNDQIYI